MIARVAPLLAALLLAATTAAAQSVPSLQMKRDPFDWTALQQAIRKNEPEAAAAAKTAPQSRLPRLRAVMRGPSGDRVNLDGEILGIGDSADGYRLLEVREYSAVFSRKGAAVELELGREQTQ